ncbi:hypothetical protein [uncultured Rhodoblastus sp.]|nr:hypothetical protein [uncultured Rhodoblastus sp.]
MKLISSFRFETIRAAVGRFNSIMDRLDAFRRKKAAPPEAQKR